MIAPAPRRRILLGRAHTLAKGAGMSEDDYRDKLELLTDHRSAKDCTDDQLEAFCKSFHVKPNTNKGYTAKVKALWIAAYNLGLLQDGSDAALDAFVSRQTGKLRLGFVTSVEANSLTEALKAICGRRGFHPPANGRDARMALLLAQWLYLGTLGQVRLALEDALEGFVSRKYLGFHGSRINMTDEQLDTCARDFGRWIRRAQPKDVTW